MFVVVDLISHIILVSTYLESMVDFEQQISFFIFNNTGTLEVHLITVSIICQQIYCRDTNGCVP